MPFVTSEQFRMDLSAALEFGFNSNGSYVKMANGVLICWNVGSRTDWAINSAYGSLYQGYVTFTYPMAFIAIPAVIPGHAQWGASASWGTLQAVPGLTTFTFRAIDTSSRASGTAVYYSWLAIGRWM